MGIRCLTALSIAFAAMNIGAISYAQKAPIILAHEVHIHEAGGFLIKTIKEAGSSQVEAAIEMACSALQSDCSTTAKGARLAANAISDKSISEGKNYYITGKVFAQSGEEWHGVFGAPEGYEVCKAALVNLEKSAGSTFTTAVFVTPEVYPEGLHFYAVVPKNRPTPQYIDSVFSIYYVPTGTREQYACAPHKTVEWTYGSTEH
jgi:hypothetical protein